jgi:hypothetical protein
MDRVLVAGEVKGSILPSVHLVAFEAGPWRCALLSGPSQSWRRWPQSSCQELGLLLVSGLISVIKFLKCHFHKISLGCLRAILCLFKLSLNIREGLGNTMRVENNCSILGRWM